MCEINGLSGLCKGWAGTPKEASRTLCWNTTDRNILRQLLPLPFFLFPDNGCKTQTKIQQMKYFLWEKILLQISHFSAIKWGRLSSRANSLRFIFMTAADCHGTEAGLWLFVVKDHDSQHSWALSQGGKGGMLQFLGGHSREAQPLASSETEQ